MNAIEPEHRKPKGNQATEATPKNLRVFGVGAAVILTAIWALRLFVFHHGSAWVLLALAGFLILTGLFVHPLLKPIYRGWMWIAHKIGWFNTRLLLGIVFYGLVMPIGILKRLLGKDAMKRKIDPSAKSYWIPVAKKFNLASYEKEF